MKNTRTMRISEEIKKIISSLIMTELKDPRIDELASITIVDLSNDHSHAKVYVSALDEKKRESTIHGLNSAKGFIKRELARELNLRIVPDLEFVDDNSIEKTFEFLEVLESVKKDHR